jgi:hypothetical protein
MAVFSELEVQARWFAGEFGRIFESVDGEAVEVVQFGVWNQSAGPDFTEAVVRVGARGPVKGAIEIDMDARDWERHGHGCNPNYEHVVLHVFLNQGRDRFFTRTLSHRQIPQLHLDGTACAALLGQVEFCGPVPALPGRCSHLIRELPQEQVSLILHAAARQRFNRKAAILSRTREVHGEGEAIFQAVAAGLGYAGNELPFRLLSQRLPARRLAADADSREALLFGVAGFIPGTDLQQLGLEARAYIRRLWRQWWTHRSAEDGLQIPHTAWRLGGQRPLNHPQRRLGALVAILGHWRAIRRMAAAREWRSLRRMLLGLSDPFWDWHYTFASRASKRRMALLGHERVQDLLVNVFLPAFGDWQPLETMITSERSRRVRVAAARLLAGRRDVSDLLRGMVGQQGLLEFYEGFCRCDSSDCKNCSMPEQISGWEGVFSAKTLPDSVAF